MRGQDKLTCVDSLDGASNETCFTQIIKYKSTSNFHCMSPCFCYFYILYIHKKKEVNYGKKDLLSL